MEPENASLGGVEAPARGFRMPAIGPHLPGWLRRPAWRAFYGFLSWYGSRVDAPFTLMNWGYHEDGLDVGLDAHPERLPLQLYAALTEGLPLEGRHVLDASAGRGGGLAWVHQHRRPARSSGVDLTPANVRRARASFGDQPGLDFQVGDVTQLPQGDESVDVVLSVEASHCYPDLPRAFAEIGRVLRPGGHVLWTDFRPREHVERDHAAIPSGLRRVGYRDITANVIDAIQRDIPRRQAMVSRAHPLLRPLIADFAAADPQCETVARFTSGRWVYFITRLQKD